MSEGVQEGPAPQVFRRVALYVAVYIASDVLLEPWLKPLLSRVLPNRYVDAALLVVVFGGLTLALVVLPLFAYVKGQKTGTFCPAEAAARGPLY